MIFLSGWTVPLRLARRDALRAKGRSVLVLAMIALPVLAVTAADVVLETQDVDSVESLDRQLGSATASVTVNLARGVVQAPDPELYSGWSDAADTIATAEQVAGVLGDARLVEWRASTVGVATEAGRADVEVLEVDLRDPVADGLARLDEGRLPRTSDEVVVNAALAAKGYAVGDRLDLTGPEQDDPDDSADPVVVGVAESAEARGYPVAMGPLGAFALPDRDLEASRSWFVDGDEVDWAEVRALNELGATVLSRAVVLDPPPLPAEAEEMVSSGDDAMATVVALVVVMALIEVVLLAGPAFAVGARRQSRSLALMTATGGTPRQARRVVLASAVVLGGVASVLGVGLGILVARLVLPVAQGRNDSWFGPFDVPWPHLAGITAFGLVSALLAAMVPAWTASRQDVVAVLAGRRGDRRPSLRSPVLGVVLLAAGIGLAAYGALGTGSGEVLIAGSAVVAVLGMILLVPVVLAGLARVSGRLPLALRYAVRDAARHRTRTVPAVAAVAATVAGVVALGISLQSDQAEDRATYVPQLRDGVGAVTWYGPDPQWDRVRGALAREVPDADVVEVRGLGYDGGYSDVRLRRAGGGRLLTGWGSPFGADLLVGPESLDLTDDLRPGDRERAVAALARGAVVAFSTAGSEGDQRLDLRVRTFDEDGEPTGPASREQVAALVVRVDDEYAGPQALLSEDAVRDLGISVRTVSLGLTGTAIDEDQEEELAEAVGALTADANVYVERGFQLDDEVVVIQLVLVGLGAVLMLGGTLTATFLALSDARPDLATLAAVGAAPRTRRGVAAAYAAVVGVVGAVLGALVGFVPGVAVTYPLTSSTGSGPFLDVPWLLIVGLVVALPLLTAAVVGLAARSRLPLVARLD
ncbi:ABC transporter permease [Nocardioides dongkuii]|uniref:ABC transporter permease n=1 Tax=Nocardioides dongkuii TaxID=2760089 RepID=UPI001877BB95|nr:ABC transporter permease [Nocardioides dongkuii]